jgi:hypothetical protein
VDPRHGLARAHDFYYVRRFDTEFFDFFLVNPNNTFANVSTLGLADNERQSFAFNFIGDPRHGAFHPSFADFSKNLPGERSTESYYFILFLSRGF